jgi:hypothetical protein
VTPISSHPTLGTQKSDVDWLWRIFSKEVQDQGHIVQERAYLQWDDSWLISILRNEYFSLLSNPQEKTPKQRIDFARLEELVASKKNYVSLIKKFDDFRDIGKGFANAIKGDTALVAQVKRLKFGNQLLSDLSDENKYMRVFDWIAFLESDKLKPETLGEQPTRGLVQQRLKAAAEKFKSDNNLLDVFLVHRPAKYPIANPSKFFMLAAGEQIALDKLSSEASSTRKVAYYPEHFIFILFEKENELNRRDLRIAFGQALANACVPKKKVRKV